MALRVLPMCSLPALLPERFTVGTLGRSAHTHELMSRFPSWRAQPGAAFEEQLWRLRGENGLWDFGPKSKQGFNMLSEDWRRPDRRKHDCSVRLLRLIRLLTS